jgi:hypothetical protein
LEKAEDAPEEIATQLEQLRQQKRMYSFQQLFNLVTTVANQSTVNDRLVTAEDNISDIFTQIK